jgi:hypothetical protein
MKGPDELREISRMIRIRRLESVFGEAKAVMVVNRIDNRLVNQRTKQRHAQLEPRMNRARQSDSVDASFDKKSVKEKTMLKVKA